MSEKPQPQPTALRNRKAYALMIQLTNDAPWSRTEKVWGSPQEAARAAGELLSAMARAGSWPAVRLTEQVLGPRRKQSLLADASASYASPPATEMPEREAGDY